MSDKQQHGNGGPGFDSEIDVKHISAFLVWMAVGIIVAGVAMYALYRNLQSHEETHDLPPSPLVDRTQRHLPPEPRLQVTPHPDLDKYLAEQQASISNYAWVDPAKGVARIPVDQAIEVLAKRGLPWKASSFTAGAAPAAPAAAAPAPAGPAAGDHSGGHH